MLLLQETGTVYVLKTWAILPVMLLSLGYGFLYWRMMRFGLRAMQRLLERLEYEHQVLIQFRRHGMVIIGKIDRQTSIKLHVQMHIGYFLAFMLPVLITGLLTFLPDGGLFEQFFTVEQVK